MPASGQVHFDDPDRSKVRGQLIHEPVQHAILLAKKAIAANTHLFKHSYSGPPNVAKARDFIKNIMSIRVGFDRAGVRCVASSCSGAGIRLARESGHEQIDDLDRRWMR